MPAIALENQLSTGHGCFPPTNCIGPYSSTVRINGKLVQLKGISRYIQHRCGNTTHTTEGRIVVEGSATIFVEGIAVVRIGDLIACGDRVARGSDNVFGGD